MTFAVATGLALLLVFLPTSVVAIKAAIAQQSTNTNSEETEDHSKEESKGVRHERISRSAPKSKPAPSTQVVLVPHRPEIAVSVAPPLHPSQFSVRRLL